MIGKIDQAAALYFPARIIGQPEGASCGRCFMYRGYPRGQGSCTVVEGAINGPNGICGLYVHGKGDSDETAEKLSKKSAGYSEEGPTHCGSCEYYGGNSNSGPCQKVSGTVEFGGCCNLWSPKEKQYGS